MSISEEIQLQVVHKHGEETEASSHQEGHKPLEQPDAAAKNVANRFITSWWKKISLTVLTLLSYAFMYAAMSAVTTYYAIVVWCNVKVCVCLCMCVCVLCVCDVISTSINSDSASMELIRGLIQSMNYIPFSIPADTYTR